MCGTKEEFGMKTISRPKQYLQQRGEVWYYIRRVPTILTEKIGRRIISRSGVFMPFFMALV